MAIESNPQTKREASSVEKSPVRTAYGLLNATSPQELRTFYDDEDQRLMHSHAWDYGNSNLVLNRVKEVLESADPSALIDEEREARSEILWFWYHHAISAALWRYRDVEAAKTYATKALEYQSDDHPNKITRLLHFLVNEKPEEAKRWAAGITDEGEASTAQSLLKQYEEGTFLPGRPYPLDLLKGAILTSEQYVDHPFARAENQRTYVFEVSHGPKTLAYFGAAHSNDPNDPMFNQITALFEKSKPQMVYVEGMETVTANKDKARERIGKFTDEQAKSNGESWYTLKLAALAGADFESPEPAFSSEIQHLLDQGFSKKDVFTFYLYRDIGQYQREHEQYDPQEVDRLSAREVKEFTDVGWEEQEIEQFRREIISNLALNDEDFYRAKVDPIPWVGKPQGVTNEISRASSAFRDQHIFERIAEGLKKYDRLFVVYGSAHAVKQEVPLKLLVEQVA